MLAEIKMLLGDRASQYTDNLLNLFIKIATNEVEGYIGKTIDTTTDIDLAMAIEQIVIIKLNRYNTEGLDSMSVGGVSESYIDGYPDNIKALLIRKRKIKVL